MCSAKFISQIAYLFQFLRVLIEELDEALRVNEAAMGNDRREYQLMLRRSYDDTVERLNRAFGGRINAGFGGAIGTNTRPRRSMSSDSRTVMRSRLGSRLLEKISGRVPNNDM